MKASVGIFLAVAACAFAQQVADTVFAPPIASPAFAEGRGPVVAIDEAHGNFHTASGRYLAFANLVRRDGFVVREAKEKFSAATLRDQRVLVIANPLHPRNASDWTLPTPSAFTPDEIASVATWVRGGGALLLIADHMPFPGAAGELAAAFGFTFSNGYTRDGSGNSQLTFRRDTAARLTDHTVTRGRSAAEAIDTVRNFTGSAFRVPAEAVSLLTLPKGRVSLECKVAARFDATTPRVDVSGWSQGAVVQVGRGRVAVFGEAAMFSAQLAGPDKRPMGMNDPAAKQNPQFLLNVLHWLAGVID